MEPVKRKAGRPPSLTQAEKPGPPLRITVDADRVLTQQAKKLKMSKGKFASAAISFFAESGLDPTAERSQNLAIIGQKVDAGVASVRVHNADIGNRLYALTRGFEKTLYLFMQQQQQATYSYMENIEGNLLQHLVRLERHMLEPMLEQIMRVKADTCTARITGERAYLASANKPAVDWKAMHDKLSTERDERLMADLREHVKKHVMPTPQPTAEPSVTPVPAKPVAPVATAPPTTPKS